LEERQLDMLEVGGSKPSPPTTSNRMKVRTCLRTVSCWIVGVARAGFEPAISALKGLRPSPLDDRAELGTLGTLIAGPAPKARTGHQAERAERA
jgi:hypothetical protein